MTRNCIPMLARYRIVRETPSDSVNFLSNIRDVARIVMIPVQYTSNISRPLGLINVFNP